ncbi:MAG: hypothetical protein ACRDC5_03490, partial [Vibrio sp.]
MFHTILVMLRDISIADFTGAYWQACIVAFPSKAVNRFTLDYLRADDFTQAKRCYNRPKIT